MQSLQVRYDRGVTATRSTRRAMFRRRLAGVAFAAIAVSCGASAHRSSAPPSTKTSVERFIEVLEHGDSLFGLGTACDEWRAEPGPAEIVLGTDVDADDDANGENESRERDRRGTEQGRSRA